MTDTTATGTPGRTASRAKLVLLVIIFSAPLLIAYALYYGGWRPESLRVFGELLQPARPLADVTLRNAEGKPAALASLRGKWSLVTFAPGECAQPCRDNLYKMQQVVLAQGREAGRVQRAFIAFDAAGAQGLQATLRDYPGTLGFVADAAAREQLARQFALPHGTPLDNLHRVYLIDPLGNLVLSYGPDADPTGLRKDLARLLRVSQVG